MPTLWQRWKVVWLTLWAVLLLISLALPALIYESKTIWIGWQAALAALPPFALSQPRGGLLALLYPLLVASLVGILRRHPFAAGTAVALVATMCAWGVMAPAQPRTNDLFGGTDPGGNLGSGFWLWLASGACLLGAALTPPLSRGHLGWSLFGFGYGAFVLIAAAT